MNHGPIMWTQLARCTITTRFRELGPGGLGCYEVVGRPDGGVGVCWYASGDEGRARRAHAILSRRLARLEDGAPRINFKQKPRIASEILTPETFGATIDWLTEKYGER